MVQARTVGRSLVLALIVALLAAGGLVGASPAEAGSRWAPAATAPVHPGALLTTPVGRCTANFVFFQDAEVFLGTAAHCFGTGGATDLDGCNVDSVPIGSPVEIEGATRPGTFAYSSWETMQEVDEQDPFSCRFNDFALVRVDPADHGLVNPTIPHWGGPTGIRRHAHEPLSTIYSIGNSPLRGGLTALQPKGGLSLGTGYGGWSHAVYQLAPGIPGDSGGPTLDVSGRATGVLSSIGVTPLPGSNHLTDMSRALRYARSHGLPRLLLALGTEPFDAEQPAIG